ncbi:uncharacterized protein LOC123538697 [Mercenaria mercenaria]|uniref:uncharacterized protein LOC123538697 n=1 Tax=Mercenaria mercenaria TaxID=6596 RepID=UPI00234EB60B|nr:uncharacterized protein LOC123538697 [Mercenaria mercenaria]
MNVQVCLVPLLICVTMVTARSLNTDDIKRILSKQLYLLRQNGGDGNSASGGHGGSGGAGGGSGGGAGKGNGGGAGGGSEGGVGEGNGGGAGDGNGGGAGEGNGGGAGDGNKNGDEDLILKRLESLLDDIKWLEDTYGDIMYDAEIAAALQLKELVEYLINEQSSSEQSTTEQSASEQSTTEQSTTEPPSTEQPPTTEDFEERLLLNLLKKIAQ